MESGLIQADDNRAGITHRTTSLCPICAKDVPAYYEARPDGVYLHFDCGEHGHFVEKAENDAAFFERAYGQDYEKRSNHLVLPITYRCNLKCKYCYTLSNSTLDFPRDIPMHKVLDYSLNYGTSTNLIGGEPTLREDLPEIISGIKSLEPGHILSISTNGQRLKDLSLVEELKNRGLDFIFLSLNDPTFETSLEIYRNKIAAIDNCLKAGMPVWLQRTVDRLEQIDSIFDITKKYKRIIFSITIRSVKPFGMKYPSEVVFVSDMVRYLKKENSYIKGTNPFNCYVKVRGKKIKLCSWVNDVGRLDPHDFGYVIANGELTTFHRGMKMDEVMLKAGSWKPSP